MTVNFRGIYPPVPTIVDDNGIFDPAGMAMMLDHVLDNGADGVLILGSGGEFAHMPTSQRKTVAAFCLEYVAGRVPVLIGIACCGTAETIELGHHAQQAGASGVLVVNPWYAKLSDQALVTHYRRIAQALAVPVLLYNFPDLTGQDLRPELVALLAAEEPNIVGIKDTVDNISHIRSIINLVRPRRPDFIVFSGYDEYLLDTLLLGGNGGIPATFNFAPHLTRGIYQAVQHNDMSAARALQSQLAALSAIYTLDTPFFGAVKNAIHLSGLPVSTAVIPPALPLPKDKYQTLENLLRHISR